MKLFLSGPGRNGRYLLALAVASFGVGILLTFFLSSRVLVLIEAFVLIATAALLLSER